MHITPRIRQVVELILSAFLCRPPKQQLRLFRSHPERQPNLRKILTYRNFPLTVPPVHELRSYIRTALLGRMVYLVPFLSA